LVSLKDTPSTSQKKEYVAYKDALGIKAMTWSPDTQVSGD